MAHQFPDIFLASFRLNIEWAVSFLLCPKMPASYCIQYHMLLDNSAFITYLVTEKTVISILLRLFAVIWTNQSVDCWNLLAPSSQHQAPLTGNSEVKNQVLLLRTDLTVGKQNSPYPCVKTNNKVCRWFVDVRPPLQFQSVLGGSQV